MAASNINKEINKTKLEKVFLVVNIINTVILGTIPLAWFEPNTSPKVTKSLLLELALGGEKVHILKLLV